VVLVRAASLRPLEPPEVYPPRPREPSSSERPNST